MNPGFHRVGGEGWGKERIRIPFPLPPSINFFSRNNQLNYSNNLITQIVTVAGKLQHDFFLSFCLNLTNNSTILPF